MTPLWSIAVAVRGDRQHEAAERLGIGPGGCPQALPARGASAPCRVRRLRLMPMSQDGFVGGLSLARHRRSRRRSTRSAAR